MNDKHCTHCGDLIKRPIHPGTVRPFCDMSCYADWQRGKMFPQQGKPLRPALGCSLPGCCSVHFGRGYCRKHYLSEHYLSPKKPKTPRRQELQCVHCGKSFLPPLKTSRYCSSRCSGASRKKPFIIKKGYRKLLIPAHPRADSKGYVFEHIVVLEATIGRSINSPEEVHHKDYNRANNAANNLVLCASHAEHMSYH